MLGGNNGNPVLPVYMNDNQFQYQSNTSNQLHLLGTMAAGCSVDPVNYFANENLAPMIRPNKRGRESESNNNNILRQQKLQISLNYNYNNNVQDEVDRGATNIPKQNLVSTGLRLSYDDDERNSSVTSGSGSMTAAPPIFQSLGDNIRMDLDRQKDELDQFIKIQADQMTKGVRDMKQRHMASFLSALEKGVSKKLQEKDLEIENMNKKNRELVERIKQVAVEAQNWHYKAKYNESVVNVLKTNLQQAMSQGGNNNNNNVAGAAAADQGKEGFGDSEIDDAASYINPNNYLGITGMPGRAFSQKGQEKNQKGAMHCKACKAKEVSVLLVPCRHLSLCKDCDVFIGVCPVCQSLKTSSVQVFFS